jgi:hypothetical protein
MHPQRSTLIRLVCLLGLVAALAAVASLALSRSLTGAGAPGGHGHASPKALAMHQGSAPVARSNGEKGACSPREPFAPPLVTTLAGQGALVLDQRRGLAIVVRSLPGPLGAQVRVTEVDTTTGAPVRTGQVSSPPIRTTIPGTASEAYYASLDERRGRLFVVHVPFGAGRAPPGRVDVIDELRPRLLRTVPLGSIPGTAVVDAETGRAFIVNQQSGTVSVLDTGSARLLRTVSLPAGALGPEPAPVLDQRDGIVIVVVDATEGRVALLDARTGAVRRMTRVGSYPQSAALDGQNGHLLVANHGTGLGGSVSLIAARSGTLLHTTAVPGSPVEIMVDASTHRAFLSYDDNFRVSMLDTASGALLATLRVRADTDALNMRIVTPEPGSEHPPTIARIDERRRWAIVDVPPILDDEGTEPNSTQLVVLDSSTGGIVHTVPTMESGWPNAVAIDDRLGRAFTETGDGIAVYDISCIAGRYNFANLG